MKPNDNILHLPSSSQLVEDELPFAELGVDQHIVDAVFAAELTLRRVRFIEAADTNNKHKAALATVHAKLTEVACLLEQMEYHEYNH